MRSFWVDINVWIALCSDRHVHYGAAHAWFAKVGPACARFCRLTQLGFLRLLTNPQVMENDVKSQIGAWRVYDALCEDIRVGFVSEPHQIEGLFRTLTQSRQATATGWVDAYLAALAKTRGLTIVSFDRGFKNMAGIDALILPALP
jgi:toxin-antitoxin system PIN domain toxin